MLWANLLKADQVDKVLSSHHHLAAQSTFPKRVSIYIPIMFPPNSYLKGSFLSTFSDGQIHTATSFWLAKQGLYYQSFQKFIPCIPSSIWTLLEPENGNVQPVVEGEYTRPK